LVRLLRHAIDGDRYQRSPRVQTFKGADLQGDPWPSCDPSRPVSPCRHGRSTRRRELS
jgi:hypothetical protein